MKKLILIVACVVTAIPAFAQGKVGLANDTARLFVYNTDTAYLRVADAAKAGVALPQQAGLFKVGLWAALGTGVAEGNLTEVVQAGVLPTSFDNTGIAAGLLNGKGVTLNTPAIPANTMSSFQIRVWEGTFATYDAAASGNGYVGKTMVFNAKGGSIAPNPLNSTLASGANSSWAAGTIYVGLIPEPSSMAIMGLGVASLLIFRRRK